MFKLFLNQNSVPQKMPFFGKNLLLTGVLAIVIGTIIIMDPPIVAYAIGSFLVFIGGSLVYTWWKMKKGKSTFVR